MKVLGLFSGIGGFELGLQRAGFEIAAMCEIDPFCRRVLAKHWPEVPIYEDVRELSGQRLWDDGNNVSIQVICGGFPCQDISIAGYGAGIDGERSGLWREYARLIGELRPRYVVVENVAALLDRGLGDVLGDLASLGYDAEWHCIPACSVGAHHIRDRVWVVAYPVRDGFQRQVHLRDSLEARINEFSRSPARRDAFPIDWESRSSEPAFLGMDDDVPDWMDRVRACGNGVVPEIPFLIGKAIIVSLNQPSLPGSSS